MGGETISREDFNLQKVDHHLKVNIQVSDENGEVIDSGRDLLQLQQKHNQGDTPQALTASQTSWSGEGIREWSFGSVPESIPVSHGGMQIEGFPAIADDGDSVSKRVFPTRPLAEQETRYGITRLATLRCKKIIKQQLRWLPDLEKHAVTASQFSSSTELKKGLSDLIARRAFVDLQKEIPSDEPSFSKLIDQAHESISIATQDLAGLLPKFFEHYQSMKVTLAEKPKETFGEIQSAIQKQLSQLLVADFWVRTPWDWLCRFPVYFNSIRLRLEKLSRPDLRRQKEIEQGFDEYFETYQQILSRHRAQGVFEPELIRFRFMIEELRVSTFSQQLGTCIPVSDKRMEKQLARLSE